MKKYCFNFTTGTKCDPNTEIEDVLKSIVGVIAPYRTLDYKKKYRKEYKIVELYALKTPYVMQNPKALGKFEIIDWQSHIDHTIDDNFSKDFSGHATYKYYDVYGQPKICWKGYFSIVPSEQGPVLFLGKGMKVITC